MMCRDAVDRMMVAELDTLRGGHDADPALAEHLRDCGRCRAVATKLVEELETLDVGLSKVAKQSPANRRRAQRVWLPLAAAAALATVLFVAGDGGRGSRPGRDAGGSETSQPARVAVTLPVDRGGAVMNTNNPNITVVWLYERSVR